jgi:hypothetical protein
VRRDGAIIITISEKKKEEYFHAKCGAGDALDPACKMSFLPCAGFVPTDLTPAGEGAGVRHFGSQNPAGDLRVGSASSMTSSL